VLEPDVLVLLPQSFSSYNTIPYQTDWYKEWRDYCLCCCSCSNEALNIEHDTYFARQHKIREASLETVTHRIMWVFRLNFYKPPRSVVYLLTLFFDTCQERWFLWREGDRFGRNQKIYRVGIGRWSSSDGPGEYALKMLICPLWCSADGELPMKSREEKRIRTLYENLDDSVVIFKVVYL